MRHTMWSGTVTGIDSGSTPDTAELVVETNDPIEERVEVPKDFARAAYDRPARMVLEVSLDDREVSECQRLFSENAALRHRLGIQTDGPLPAGHTPSVYVLRSEVAKRLRRYAEQAFVPVTASDLHALAAEYEASDE